MCNLRAEQSTKVEAHIHLPFEAISGNFMWWCGHHPHSANYNIVQQEGFNSWKCRKRHKWKLRTHLRQVSLVCGGGSRLLEAGVAWKRLAEGEAIKSQLRRKLTQAHKKTKSRGKGHGAEDIEMWGETWWEFKTISLFFCCCSSADKKEKQKAPKSYWITRWPRKNNCSNNCALVHTGAK